MERHRAHEAVRYALKAGKLVKPDRCSRCQAVGPVMGHHHDYSKRLEVEWVCRLCHLKEHGFEPIFPMKGAAISA